MTFARDLRDRIRRRAGDPPPAAALGRGSPASYAAPEVLHAARTGTRRKQDFAPPFVPTASPWEVVLIGALPFAAFHERPVDFTSAGRLYVSWFGGSVVRIARSDDEGLSWLVGPTVGFTTGTALARAAVLDLYDDSASSVGRVRRVTFDGAAWGALAVLLRSWDVVSTPRAARRFDRTESGLAWFDPGATVTSRAFATDAQASDGGGDKAWTNPAGAKAAGDGQTADVVLLTDPAGPVPDPPPNLKSGEWSDFLKVNDLRILEDGLYIEFDVPSDRTVTGITVSVAGEAVYSPPSFPDEIIKALSARLMKGGVPAGQDKGQPAGFGSGAVLNGPFTVVYGGASDLWGETWPPSDVNAAGFGFRWQCGWQRNVGGPQSDRPAQVTGTVRVDALTLTIHINGVARRVRFSFLDVSGGIGAQETVATLPDGPLIGSLLLRYRTDGLPVATWKEGATLYRSARSGGAWAAKEAVAAIDTEPDALQELLHFASWTAADDIHALKHSSAMTFSHRRRIGGAWAESDVNLRSVGKPIGQEAAVYLSHRPGWWTDRTLAFALATDRADGTEDVWIVRRRI